MKILIAAALLAMTMSACVVVPDGAAYQPAVVAYEPDVVVGDYYVGYYDPAYGYWTGYGWDLNFYAVGHAGYGHYYRGAPGFARGNFHGGGRVGGRGHGGVRGHR